MASCNPIWFIFSFLQMSWVMAVRTLLLCCFAEISQADPSGTLSREKLASERTLHQGNEYGWIRHTQLLCQAKDGTKNIILWTQKSVMVFEIMFQYYWELGLNNVPTKRALKSILSKRATEHGATDSRSHYPLTSIIIRPCNGRTGRYYFRPGCCWVVPWYHTNPSM